MTAKEKMLERAPHWSEEQAERALRAAESEHDERADWRGQTQALAEQAEDRLRARERVSGDSWRRGQREARSGRARRSRMGAGRTSC